MNMTDAVLLERWRREQDADAFAELTRRYSGLVFNACKRVLNDPAQAEDVAQECFIELMRSREGVRASLGGWLHTMAVCRSMDHIKRDTRRRQREARYAGQRPEARSLPDAAVSEILSRVDEAIAALPAQLQAAVVARFLEGRSYTEIARESGVSEAAIRYRVDKALIRIRTALKRFGVAASGAAITAALSAPAEAAPASLISRVGKLAISGSISPVATPTITMALSIKVAAAILVGALAGVGLWAGYRAVTDNSGAAPNAPSYVDTAQAEPAAPDVSPAAAQSGQPAPQTPASSSGLANAAAPSAPGEFSIRGRVYDAVTGEGIEGVRLQVYPSGGGPQTARSEPTGPDGHYTIPPIPDGMYTISLEKEPPAYPDPRRSRHVSVAVKTGEPATGVDFALEKGIQITGVVVDANGAPVEGADIGAITETVVNWRETHSGADGRFALFMPDVTEQLMIQAQTDRWESEPLMGLTLPREGLDGITLILDQPRSASVSGVVIDRTGKGVEGANVYLIHKSKRVFAHGGHDQTSSDGLFSIESCAAGEYGVIVTPKGASGFSTSEEYLRVALAEGEALEGVEILFGEKGGFTIAGRVLDKKGQPIARATVTSFGEKMERAYTDAQGAFLITGLNDTSCNLRVEHPNYSSVDAVFTAGSEDLEIVLRERGRLSGRVTDAQTGAPLTAFSLAFVYGEASSILSDSLWTSGRPMESADGSFSMGGLDARAASVAAWAPGFAPAYRVVNIESGESAQVDFALKPAPPFEGAVVDEAGTPIVGAAIYFVEGISADRMDMAAAARTDEDGRFTLTSLPEEATRVCAYKVGYGAGVLELPADGPIVLPAQGVVEGVIRGAEVPFSDIAVNAYYPNARHLPHSYSPPNNDGTFRLTGLSPGELTVSVYPNGGPRHAIMRAVSMQSGNTVQLDFIFERGAAVIEGTLESGGRPVTSAHLSLQKRAGDLTEELRAAPNAEGRYRFDRVWAGPLTLIITRYKPDPPYDFITEEIPLELEEGQVLEQNISLYPMP